MADEMIFGVGFDVDGATENAIKDWRTAQKKLQRQLDSDTLNLKIKVDGSDDTMTDLKQLQTQLKELSKEYDALSFDKKFVVDDDGSTLKLSAEAEALVTKFSKLTIAIETYGRTLKQVASDSTKEMQKQAKEAENSAKEYERWWTQALKSVDSQRVAEAKALSIESTASADDRAYYAELERLSDKRIEDEKALDVLIKQQQERRFNAEVARGELEDKIYQTQQSQIKKKQADWDSFYATVRKYNIDQLTTESTASADDRSYYAQLEKETAERYKHITLAKQKVAILTGEEKTINQINAKLAIQRQRLQNIDVNSDSFTRINTEVQRLTTLLAQAETRIKKVSATNLNPLRTSMASVNKEMSTQLTYVDRLIQRMGVYGAIFATVGFVRNVREVTAEFELQRVSLAAMMQSASEADALFEKTVAAAVQSPFEIKDLVQYTKQLAAFGVENDKLFDTTQMLADITAGLGADFSRIALAFGQIRSKGYLAGTELKQLTELGLAFPQMLAEQLTEVEGTAVSVSDVFDRISRKEITFGMVENIFKELTEDGGRFYDLQAKQAQTLAGLWSNLKDEMSVMYSEVGTEYYDTMKGAIELLKSLVANWQTLATVLKAAGWAYATYWVMMKNSAITAVALNKAELKNIITTQTRTIGTSKLIAAIWGKSAAETASIKVSKLYTAATAKAAASTNIFTKSFWKLTAAMLANPYVAVTAALVGLGVGLLALIPKAKTVEESLKDLASASSGIKDNMKSEQLIDEYETLSKKINKTKVESDRFKTVSRELARLFPDAIVQVKNYGDEFEIAADKARDMIQAVREAYEEVQKAEISNLEKQLKKNTSEYAKLQKQIEDGYYTEVSTSGFSTRIVKLDTEEKKNILLKMEELDKSNKDITTKIDLYTKAKSKEIIESIDGWQKTFVEARKSIEQEVVSFTEPETPTLEFDATKLPSESISEYLEQLTEVGERTKTVSKIIKETPLYTEEQVGQFSTLNAILEDNAKTYKDNEANIKQYSKTLESIDLTDKEREQVTLAKEFLEAENEARLALLERYNAEGLVSEQTEDATSKRIKSLQTEASLVQEIYKRYKEYLKYKSSEEAQAMIADTYGESIASLTVGSVAFDDSQLTASLTDIKNALIKTYKQATTEAQKQAAKDAAIKLGLTIEDVEWTGFTADLKAKLTQLSNDIKRSQEAQSFMSNILSATGNETLSREMTISVYGDVGNDLADKMGEQVRTAFGGSAMSKGLSNAVNSAIDTATGSIDYAKINKLVESLELTDALREQLGGIDLSAFTFEMGSTELLNVKELLADKDVDQAVKDIVSKLSLLPETYEANVKAITKSLETQAKTQKTTYASLIKSYAGYETQRVILTNEANNKIKTIEAESAASIKSISANTTLTEEEKAEAIKRVQEMAKAMGLAITNELNSALFDLDVTNIEALRLAFGELSNFTKEQLTKNLVTLRKALSEAADPESIQRIQNQIAATNEALNQSFSAPVVVDLEEWIRLKKQQTTLESELTKETERGEQADKGRVQSLQAQLEKLEEELGSGVVGVGLTAISFGLETIASGLTEVAEASGDADLANTASQISDISSILSSTLSGLASGGVLGAAIGAATSLISAIANSFVQAAVSAAEATQNATDYANALQLLALAVDEDDYDSIWGTKSLEKATVAYATAQEALAKYNEYVNSAFTASDVYVGNDYALMTADISSLSKSLTDLQAIQVKTKNNSGFANWLGFADEYTSLAELAPEIWEDGVFNIENAQAFLDTNTQLTDEQRAQIQNAIDLGTAYEDAMAIVEDTVSEFTSSMASDLADVIWDSVANGTSAWSDFLAVGSDVISELGKQMLSEFIMSAYLDQYKEDMTNAFASDDPATAMAGVIANIFSGMDTMIEGSSIMAEQWQDMMEEYGFTPTSSDSSLTGISKDIATASEESILGLAAGINTQNYYIALIKANTDIIAAILQGGSVGLTTASTVDVTELITTQNAYLQNLPSIALNTANTVAECQNIVVAANKIVNRLDRVIKTKGSTAAYAVKMEYIS